MSTRRSAAGFHRIDAVLVGLCFKAILTTLAMVLTDVVIGSYESNEPDDTGCTKHQRQEGVSIALDWLCRRVPGTRLLLP